MQSKEHILKILEGTKNSIQKGDSTTIKNLSNQTTNTAALTHDPDNIVIAVIVYSISKILERENYKKLPGWDAFYNTIFKCINDTIVSIKNNDEAKIKDNLNCLRNSIIKISGSFKKNIQDIFRKASINKASRIYEHGISMGKTANLLGITKFELANYVGQKEEISERPIIKNIDVKSRINLAMEMFR